MLPCDEVIIPVIYNPLVLSSVPLDPTPPQTLQVYRRQVPHCPPDDSLLVPTPPMFPRPLQQWILQQIHWRYTWLHENVAKFAISFVVLL